MRPKLELFHQKNYNVFYTKVVHGGLYGFEKSKLKRGAAPRKTNYGCTAGRIFGAGTIGTMRLMPKDAKKPADGWRKGHKYE